MSRNRRRAERRAGKTSTPPARASPGRRRIDRSFGEIATRKVVVATVILANALYLVGEILLFGTVKCL